MYKGSMWPQLVEVSDGVGAGNSYRHFCTYSIIRKTVEKTYSEHGIEIGKRWTERCRCKRLIEVDCKYAIEGSKSPQILKHWYDQDGNFERTTGDSGPNGLKNDQDASNTPKDEV